MISFHPQRTSSFSITWPQPCNINAHQGRLVPFLPYGHNHVVLVHIKETRSNSSTWPPPC